MVTLTVIGLLLSLAQMVITLRRKQTSESKCSRTVSCNAYIIEHKS